MNALLRVRVPSGATSYAFVCELQIHHAGLRKAEKASHSHDVYERFAGAGKKRAPLQRLRAPSFST